MKKILIYLSLLVAITACDGFELHDCSEHDDDTPTCICTVIKTDTTHRYKSIIEYENNMYHIYQFDSNEINLGGGYYGSNYEVRNRFYLSELSTEEFKKLGYNISLDSTSDIKQYCISNFSIYDSKNLDYFTIDEVRNYIKDGKFLSYFELYNK